VVRTCDEEVQSASYDGGVQAQSESFKFFAFLVAYRR
jgi:hypothetical protein